MYVTFSEGPLPSILCLEAIQWVLDVLRVPMNQTNWVLVGSQSPHLAVQLHIRLMLEVSVVSGLLKATVDELPKETNELTTCTLRAADSLVPIYGDFVLPQLDKGVPADRTGIAYVPDDPDEQDCPDSMLDVDAKPKANPKPKASKPKPKKGAASSPPGVNAGGSREPQATPTIRARSPCDEAPAAHGDDEQTQPESKQLVTPHKGNTSQLCEPNGQSPSPEGLQIFANLASGGTSPAAPPHQQTEKGTRFENKRRQSFGDDCYDETLVTAEPPSSEQLTLICVRLCLICY